MKFQSCVSILLLNIFLLLPNLLYSQDIKSLEKQVEELKAQNEIYRTEISSLTYQIKQLEKQSDLSYRTLSEKLQVVIQKYNELLTKPAAAADESSKKIELAKVPEGQPQYIRIKSVDKETDIDILVKPEYVDMSIDIPKKEGAQELKKPLDAKPPEEKQVKEVVEYVEKSIENKSIGNKTINKDVLKDLHETQKLFYAKKYYDALKAVQRSLVAQETALGYALQGSIFYTLGDANAAINSWESAIKLDPAMEEVQKALQKYGRK